MGEEIKKEEMQQGSPDLARRNAIKRIAKLLPVAAGAAILGTPASFAQYRYVSNYTPPYSSIRIYTSQYTERYWSNYYTSGYHDHFEYSSASDYHSVGVYQSSFYASASECYWSNASSTRASNPQGYSTYDSPKYTDGYTSLVRTGGPNSKPRTEYLSYKYHSSE